MRDGHPAREFEIKLEIPAGALTRSVPVTVIPLRTQDVTFALPGYTMLTAPREEGKHSA